MIKQIMKNFYSGLIILLFLFGSCTYDKQVDPLEGSGYPTEVGKIIVNKCATAGCHNSLSRANAGGLDFSTWDLMFEGGRNGSSVIPFSTDYSYCLLYTSDAADERSSVDLGGRRIIKKNKIITQTERR